MSRMRNHPLGFREWTLLKVGRLTVTLHDWPQDTVDADVHSHRFSFASVLLKGALIEHRYSTAGGDPMRVLRCPAGCHPAQITPTGQTAHIREEAARRHRAPSAYAGRMGQFHRVEAPRRSLTLFAKLEHRDSPAESMILRP
jgi:hypothetical protein